MLKPAVCVLRGQREQPVGNRFFKGRSRSGFAASQRRLELGEGLFKGGEIGGVGRSKPPLTCPLFDELAHTGRLVHAQVLHHHDLPCL